MYKRIAAILLPVVTVFLIGAAVWGYQENKEKNSILIKAENQYQRAFHDLVYQVNRMEDELAKAQVVASDGGTRKCMINIWRLSSQAINEVNQLPLTLLEFSKTEEFLSSVSDFTYQVGVRDLSNKPLTEKEKTRLKQLKQQAQQISKKLSSVRTKVLDNNLRWMDVEMALASEEVKMDNTIIDGFKTIDKNVSQYTATNEDPTMMKTADKKKKLKGKKVSPGQVKRNAAQFLGLKSTDSIKVLESNDGLEYDFYSVEATRDGQDDIVYLDVSRVGGQVLWMMDYRQIGQERIGFDQAEQKALQFAADKGLDNMVTVNRDSYDDVAVFTLAPREGGVILYPDTAVIKVALDNGDVTGYQATDYVYNHKERNLPKPKLSVGEAQNKVNKGLSVVDSNLALIRNEQDQEVLVYEFIGQLDGGYFRVFINALDGTEEKVEKIRTVNAKAK